MKNLNMQRMGDSNGRWQGGRSEGYRRALMNAGYRESVHHKNGDKTDNRKENFIVLKPKGNVSAEGMHNKIHREKGGHNKKKK